MPIVRRPIPYLCYCHIWCVMPWLLVVGCYEQSSRLCVRDEGNCVTAVSISWWLAYKCPKHVEQIISAIKHSVASSWFSSLRLYYDTRTNINQIWLILHENIFWISAINWLLCSPYLPHYESRILEKSKKYFHFLQEKNVSLFICSYIQDAIRYRPYHESGDYSPVCHWRGPGSISDPFWWYL